MVMIKDYTSGFLGSTALHGWAYSILSPTSLELAFRTSKVLLFDHNTSAVYPLYKQPYRIYIVLFSMLFILVMLDISLIALSTMPRGRLYVFSYLLYQSMIEGKKYRMREST